MHADEGLRDDDDDGAEGVRGKKLRPYANWLTIIPQLIGHHLCKSAFSHPLIFHMPLICICVM